jgi:histidinol dehydrogenase
VPLRLDARKPGFERAFAKLLGMKRETAADVEASVAAILADVRRRGDHAVIDHTKRFDGLALVPRTMRVDDEAFTAATGACDPRALAALRFAARRIEAYHRRQKPKDLDYRDGRGVRLGARWRALAAVGLYVPGGKAAYPSSLLMNAIPAKVAGVERVAVAVPAPGGVLNPLVLAAARLVGIDEIYRIGGAQAIAAFAYGTRTIAPVDKIVGPGNAYVAAAKRQVFGAVGIDMIAGPSEILVIADRDSDPAWIAADLLSQAEHDEAAQAILITDHAAFADEVAAAVERHLAALPRARIARASWRRNGAIIVVASLEDAAPLADRIAAEHVELALADPSRLARRIRNAGALFLGRHTPEAVGDYVGGPNHVLPTARSARFASGLGVLDFMKRTSVLGCSKEALAALGPAAIALAEAEGLEAHALSVRLRLARAAR